MKNTLLTCAVALACTGCVTTAPVAFDPAKDVSPITVSTAYRPVALDLSKLPADSALAVAGIVSLIRGEAPQVLSQGVFVVSNGLMSDDWEKTKHLRKRFTQEFLPMLQVTSILESDLQHAVWDILEDERKVIPDLLPNTGINAEMEALLSSTFIQSPVYGTRCSNFLRIGLSELDWIEKTQQGEHLGELVEVKCNIER